jgi:kynureninase
MKVTDRTYALELDKNDPLADYRSKFVITDPDLCYLDGNSLGRLPHATVKVVSDYLTQEWGNEVVTGWGHWIDEAQSSGDLLGRAVLGAAPGQVLVCDTTSVNFYQLCLAAINARPGRKTIITDAANFPTDRYILDGIAKHHGLNLVIIDNEDPAIAENELITAELLDKYMSEDVALVTFEVIQYRSGARTDIKSITDLARNYGALVLWDASHAAGAIELNFDENGVDLAVGCTYKYGNAGPGAPAWLYVNKKIQTELHTPIQGWFANEDQFGMGAEFVKAAGIRGFQIASPSIIGIRAIQVSFAMIEEAGINVIASKAAIGTQMMIDLFDEWLAPIGYTLLTSRNPQERGGHISIGHPDAAKICLALRKFANVIPDYRTPDTMRLAISPLATSYAEVWDGFQRIKILTETRQYEKVEESNSRVT